MRLKEKETDLYKKRREGRLAILNSWHVFSGTCFLTRALILRQVGERSQDNLQGNAGWCMDRNGRLLLIWYFMFDCFEKFYAKRDETKRVFAKIDVSQCNTRTRLIISSNNIHKVWMCMCTRSKISMIS